MTVEIVVRGRHMELSDSFRDLVTEKLGRMERYGLDISRIDVEVSRERNPRLADRAIEVELTCRGRGPLIRAEAHAADKYAALDDASDTLAERLRRIADKRRSQRRRQARLIAADEAMEMPAPEPTEATEDGAPDLPPDVVLADGPLLVRQKTHTTRPMTVLDALDALEAVGHDFFFYYDVDAGRPSVIYRRRGYDYGLIRLDVAAEDGRAAS
ncbi:MAG: ribosome-associated translation inhibitor RaiA [Candidatus Nanopelagicales bacterium]